MNEAETAPAERERIHSENGVLMPHIAPTTAKRPAAAPFLRPLTRTRRDSGEPYRREASVETEIAALLQTPARVRRERLLTSRGASDPLRLREETLAYFVRGAILENDTATADGLVEVLIERTAGHVSRELAKWRLTPAEAEDCARDLYAYLCGELFCTDARAEFWEVRFWVCLDRRLANLAAKRQAIQDAELRPGDEPADGSGDTDAGSEGIFGRLRDDAPGPDILAENKEAIALLKDEERTAIYLRYVVGLPEESDDPDRPTVAKALGVTGRSVRNYLRRAEAKLRTWSG